MTEADDIIRDLGSPVPWVRNEAAMRLLDSHAADAIPALATAIAKEENIGNNGTLVYVLGHFECSSYFGLLVRVALRHGFEASMEATDILAKHDLALQACQLEEAKTFIESLGMASLADFQKNALAGIRERFYAE